MEYTETAILLAVMEQDYEKADRLIADMLPGEVAVFLDQLQQTIRRVTEVAAG